jgi:hypothetical protein
MKLLIMQFSPAFCHEASLWADTNKYSHINSEAAVAVVVLRVFLDQHSP